METFGQFIDDIRKEIKVIDIKFLEEPLGESMTITVPLSNKKYIVDTTMIGKIKYNTVAYSELLEMTLKYLKTFNKST